MTTAELLEYFRQHMEAIAKMEAYIKTPEMISYKEMIEEIEIDHFAGYERFFTPTVAFQL